MSAKHGTPVKTTIENYRGSVIEFSGLLGDVCVTVDGVEKVKTSEGERVPFPTVEHAREYARRRIDARRKATTTEVDGKLGFDVSWWHREGYQAAFERRFVT